MIAQKGTEYRLDVLLSDLLRRFFPRVPSWFLRLALLISVMVAQADVSSS